jgi:hypothetical protein
MTFDTRFTLALLLSAATATIAPASAHAACNLIPGERSQFDGALGVVDRPFAGPGEPVEVSLRDCDQSPGLSANAADHVVTVLFTPPAGPPSAVVLTAASDCSAIAPDLGACEAALGAGAAAFCVSGATAGLEVVEQSGVRNLRFRFPDTDARCSGGADDGHPCAVDGDCTGGTCAPDDDDRTLAGAARIIVTASDAPLACGISTCAAAAGTLACVDDLFRNTGACEPRVPSRVFPAFTALPPPNQYARECTEESPPCDALLGAQELRAAVDVGGNVLLPVVWDGIRAELDGIPAARLVEATLALPIAAPPSFLRSFSPEGRALAPVFEPKRGGPGLRLFGSTDAPYTILRLARRSDAPGACSGGDNDGDVCNADGDCPGGTCGDASCVGGSADGTVCRGDVQCPGGSCGAGIFDMSGLVVGGGTGPAVLERAALADGVCQNDPSLACTPGSCPSGPCVGYKLTTGPPVPLEGLVARNELGELSLSERIDQVDRNGDGDDSDLIVTLREPDTGIIQPLGPTPGCGLDPGAIGRAVIRVSSPPLLLPAVAKEDGTVAFVESESGQGCDVNGDGDQEDGILRVFEVGPTELTSGLPALTVDAAPVINDRALVVSDGLVVFRGSELDRAAKITERVSTTSGGAQAVGGDSTNPAAPLGGTVPFQSDATNLVAGDGNAATDVFEKNMSDGSIARLSVGPANVEANGASTNPARWGGDLVFESAANNLRATPDGNGLVDVFGRRGGVNRRFNVDENGNGAIGGDSRHIEGREGDKLVFESDATNLVAGDTNGVTDVFENFFGFSFGGSTNILTLVSVATDGGPANGPSRRPTSHVLGLPFPWVAYESDATNLVVDDDNGVTDVFLAGYTFFDVFTTRVSVGPGGMQANGPSRRPYIAADGDAFNPDQIVAFESDATNLVPGDTNGAADVFVVSVRDGVPTRAVERVSVATGGGQADGPSSIRRISQDGRYVAFVSDATNLVSNDTNGATDVFVHDRVTRSTTRVNVDSAGNQSAGDAGNPASVGFQRAADGIAFASGAGDLVANDTNGLVDVFLRRADPADPLGAGALYPDGFLGDSVLQVFDSANPGPPITLCPTSLVRVKSGRVVYTLAERPVEEPGTAACPAGDLDGNGADDDDRPVLQYWDQSLALPVNLARRVDGVAMSDGWIAAAIYDPGGPRLGVHKICTPILSCDWIRPNFGGNFRLMNGDPAVAGGFAGALAVEQSGEEQGVDLNGDGDTGDDVLQLYDATKKKVINTELAATDFVMGERAPSACGDVQLTALRVRELRQGNTDLNDDGDTDDQVMAVHDAVSGVTRVIGQAAVPCTFPACDPRTPYRVEGSKITFLTAEADQGGQDLSGEGHTDDVVLQVYDFCGNVVTPIGPVDERSPLDSTKEVETSTIALVEAGRCDGGACTLGGNECGQGELCELDRCEVGFGTCARHTEFPCATDADCHRCILRVPGSCLADGDCPSGTACETQLVTAVTTAADGDGDGVPDELDNCPEAANPTQTDGDGDRIGDRCDIAPLSCAPTPMPGCRLPSVPGSSPLVLKDSAIDTKDAVSWKWSKGSDTALADFGDPTTTEGYVLCIYDAAPGLDFAASAPAGGACKNGKPCWKASGTKGFKYGDAERTPEGVQKLTLQSGPAGKAKIGFTGKAEPLQMPALDGLIFPLVVQLQGTHGECWAATYAAPPLAQSAGLVKAKDGP